MTPAKKEKMLTPRQVAERFAVDPKTVARWAKTGKLPFIRTLGGHRRYSSLVIDNLVAKLSEQDET